MRALLGVIVLLLAGCVQSGAPGAADEGAQSSVAGTYTQLLFAAPIEGNASLELDFQMPQDSTCKLAGFLHYMTDERTGPFVIYWTLDRIEEGRSTIVIGTGYTVGADPRVHVGTLDTAPLEESALGLVPDVEIAPSPDEFTAWAGVDAYALRAGDYSFRIIAPLAHIAKGDESIGNNSIALGVACDRAFSVSTQWFATNAQFRVPDSTTGDTDIRGPYDAASIMAGRTPFRATTNRTWLKTEAARVKGWVKFEGPVKESLALDSLDQVVGGEGIPVHERLLPPGDYDVSWDIMGYDMYWILWMASFEQAPASWAVANWQAPF